MDNKQQKPKQKQCRVVTFLKRADLDFLDELEKDIYFSHGIHIPRAELIEEIIEAFKEKGGTDKATIEQELLAEKMHASQENAKILTSMLQLELVQQDTLLGRAKA